MKQFFKNLGFLLRFIKDEPAPDDYEGKPSDFSPREIVKIKNGEDLWMITIYRYPSMGRDGWIVKAYHLGSGVYAKFHEKDLVSTGKFYDDGNKQGKES